MTRFAAQRARAFSLILTISQQKINEIPLKIFSCYCEINKLNRPDFFMVCTLIDHRNDAIRIMFKTQVEPRACGLKIFSGISFIFRCNIVKTESSRTLRCKSRHFVVCTLIDHSPKPISAREFRQLL